MTSSSRAALLVVLAASALAGCDNRAAFQEPEPTLARMLSQRRADPYEPSRAFPDGKVMQRPPLGTVPIEDDEDAPVPSVTRELMEQGKQRFDRTCAVCHGVTGTGESVVATKMELRPAPSIVDDDSRAYTRERLFQIVTEGYGLMPGYADMLSREERWATVAYVQALQLSQRASVAELPPALRDRLEQEAR